MSSFDFTRCLAAALMSVALAAPAFAQPLLEYQGADRSEKIVQAAKEEGELTLYTSIAEKDIPPLIKPFEEKYGIKVKIWRAGTDKVLQRTLTEAQAGRHDVDAIHISAPEMEALSQEKVLQPVKSPLFGQLLPKAVPDHREWAATMLTVFVQAYNTDRIKKEDLPQSFEDLKDPKWKGKLGIETEDFDWFAAVVTALGEEKGVQLFRDIVATNGISVRKGHSLLTNMVVAGEVPLGLTVYNYMPEAAKERGAPIDWFTIDPVVARANGIGITRNAKHPNAALLFYDYMLSQDAQRILASLSYVPSSTQVESPLKGMELTLIDPEVSLSGMAKWSQLYDQVIVSQGRR
ncbi:extracellular solute-binding protein [Pusillimonas caeni]|uniref:ABC transporter substrate-binding protein n=1 Tax=Pusillimonas caeni TaxID=1348472 RepID=UPI000E59D7F2|nr:extracellular solute-binding protein [Pusillimonas caeni]TFL09421.1 extracellular solute-binding protein [Pusillimonas caeni]